MSAGRKKDDPPRPVAGSATRAREYRSREEEMRRLAAASALAQRRGLYLAAAARYALLAQLEEAALARAGAAAPEGTASADLRYRKT